MGVNHWNKPYDFSPPEEGPLNYTFIEEDMTAAMLEVRHGTPA